MLTGPMVFLRSIALICGGHRVVVLENLALRQQLAVLTRTVKRPQLRSTDRLFWILLAKGWRDWRSALVVVQPDTVVRWHRQWLRRHWTRLSRRGRQGCPTTSSAIRALVSTMTTANPLSGAPRIHGELAKLGIRSRSGPCRGSYGDRAARCLRHGRRFSPIMSPRWCRWTSSPCLPSPTVCSSSWSCSATSAGESSTSTSDGGVDRTTDD